MSVKESSCHKHSVQMRCVLKTVYSEQVNIDKYNDDLFPFRDEVPTGRYFL